MSSAGVSSPKFKNLSLKLKQSPQELKEKMRKSYKDKVHSCREMLIDRFRGPLVGQDLQNSLTEIYKSVFNFSDDIDNDEIQLFEILKMELIHEELEWWTKEYEKSQMVNVDWSKMEDENVICPVCQKTNLKCDGSSISCSICQTRIKSVKLWYEIKLTINTCVNKHNAACAHDPQFAVFPESNGNHVYLICDYCPEMYMIM